MGQGEDGGLWSPADPVSAQAGTLSGQEPLLSEPVPTVACTVTPGCMCVHAC